MIPCAPSKLSKCLTLTLAVGAALLGARSASAASTLRADRNLFGDAVVIGNMLAWDCANPSSGLVVGTVGTCGTNSTSESGSDVFWTTDGSAAGTLANTGVTLAQARSRAVLQLPAGAKVVYARLYWSARIARGTAADTAVTLTRPGVAPLGVVADYSYVFTPTDGNADDSYYGTADVTDFVAARGAGAFEVSGVDSIALLNFNDQTTYAGWSLVVFYERDKALYPAEPLRNLTVFDGLDRTQSGAPTVYDLSGFRVPETGFDAKLSVIAYEGDNAYDNDTLTFRSQAGTNTRLSNSLNPSANFFNGTRSKTSSGSTAVSAAVAGDLPQVTGAAGSLSGMDIDTVDITTLVAKGNTTARVTADATGFDRYFLNVFVFSAATLEPAYDPVKSVVNLTRADGTFRGGDVLEYTITATNTGTDPSISTRVDDPLPPGLTYVTNSASVVSGTGTFVGLAGNTLRWNVGTGSSASAGGQMDVGASITVRFRATLAVGYSGNLDNDARIIGAGKAGAAEQIYPTRPPLGTGPTRVEAQLPAAPAIEAPTAGQLVRTVRPAFSGTAEASVTVIVRVGGTEVCRTTASAAGAWSCVPTADLAQGANTASATATDGAGNTSPATTRSFTVDTVAPDTTLLSGPATHSASTSASLTFDSADATASFECSLDGGSYVACTSAQAYSGLAQGSHTFQVRAKDPAGNEDATPASHAWAVDSVVPDTLFTQTPPTLSSSNSASFAFGATETNVTYACNLDSAASFTFCNVTETFLGLADGSHTLAVQAVDFAGNADASPAVYTWTVDTAAPETTIVSGPPARSQGASATFDFGSGDASAGFQCSLDGAAFASCSDPQTFAGLQDGDHTLAVRAVDGAGNSDATPATYAWTVDAAVPDTTLTTTTQPLTRATSATFDLAADEAGASFECSLDGAAFVACVGPVTFVGLADGSHTLQVRARDGAGNVDATPASFTWTVDTQAPETTVVSGPATLTNATSASFALHADDAAASFECSLDGASFEACAAPALLAFLTDGAHTLDVRAVDAAGNVDPTPARHGWTVDTAVPDTSVVSGPASLTGALSATFVFGSSETGVTYECRLDAALGFTACSNPETFAALATGEHSLEVRARDAAGNVDPTPARYAWNIDLSAPETAIVSGPAALTHAESATFDFDAGESDVTYECSLDGAGFVACADPVTFSGLGHGEHTLLVRAVDAAGNVDASAASHTWTVDLQAPAAPVVTAPANGSQLADNAPTYAGTAEAGATVTVSVDGQVLGTAVADASGSWRFPTTAALADGPHTVTATARDAAGNVGPATSSRFDVDTAAPTAPVVTAPADRSTVTTGTPTLKGTAEPGSTLTVTVGGKSYGPLAVDAMGAWTFTLPEALGEGAHTVTVTARDAAGNESTASSTFTVDTQAPETELTGGPQSTPTAQRSATFTLSSPDAGVTFECRVNSEPFAVCDAEKVLTGLVDGAYTLQARAVDAAGNKDATPASRTWTVDTVAPVAPVLTAPQNEALITDTQTPALTGTAEPYSTVTVTVDGQVVGTATVDANGTWSFTFPAPLPDGEHALSLSATDAAGNKSAPAHSTFTLDVGEPDTTLVEKPEAYTPATTARFTFTSDEQGGGFECSLDGAAFALCTTPWDIGSLALGEHTFAVRAVDTDGFVDTTPATYTWKVGVDTDGDGLTDELEDILHTDPNDPDTDGDGIPDGTEDKDRDGEVDPGETDPRDTDSDNDGIPDGVEDTDHDGQVDPGETDPSNPDTDGGSVLDGEEDKDHDGEVDPGETDPRSPDDDVDADGDGVSNETETDLGLDPFNPDSDGDGIPDGADGTDDTDGDGTIDALDPDSDNDGIPDGVEDKDQDGVVDPGETSPDDPDSDDDGIPDGVETGGNTGTDPTNPDSDGDGIPDGVEDKDHDGIVDPGETNPTTPDSDNDGIVDGIDTEPGDALGSDSSSFRVLGGGCSTSGAGLLAPFAALLLLPLLRRRRRAAAVATAGVSLLAGLASPPASAQATQASRAIDVQQFKPGPGAEDLLGVYSPHVARHLDWSVGATLNGSDDPLAFVEVGSEQTLSRIVDSQYGLDLMGSVGLFGRFELGAALPVSFIRSEPSGSVDPDFQQGGSRGGVGDLRLVPRARLLELANRFELGLAVPVVLPTAGGRDFFGGEGVMVQPRLLAEWRSGLVRLTANAGLNLRKEQQLRNLTVGNALSYGVGAELPFQLAGQSLAAQATLVGARALGEGQTEEQPLELLAALRWNVDPRFAVQVGAGPGLSGGYGTPDYRVLVGFTYRAVTEPAPAAVPAPAPVPQDTDGDGLVDTADACPAAAETHDGHEDADGCPDSVPVPVAAAPVRPPDADADGIPDAQDACPDEAETRNGLKDDDGCADEEETKVRVEAGRLTILDKVYFATNRDLILKRSFPLLQQVAAVLQANPQLTRVRVEGHTDARGEDAKNLHLSQRRARSVRAFLVRAGVAPGRLEAVGYGETQPVDTNATAAGRDNNRRVEFRILDAAAGAAQP